jgi:hypothetical protein
METAASVATQDRLDKRTALTNDPGAPEQELPLAGADKLAQENPAPLRAAENPPESSGSGSLHKYTCPHTALERHRARPDAYALKH